MDNLKQKRIAIGALFMLMGTIFSSWTSRIPDIKQSLDLSEGALGTLLFAIPIGQALSILPAGMLVARFGSKTILTIAALIYASALASISLTYSYLTLFAALICLGFGANFMDVAINTQAVFLEHAYGRSIMASLHGMWSLGGLAGAMIGTAFVQFAPALSAHFTTIFALGLATIAFAYRHLIPGLEMGGKADNADKFSLRHIDKALWTLGLITFASMFCEGITYDWSAVYFESVIQPSDELIRLGYIAGIGAVTAGRFVMDKLITRYGAARVLMLCGALLLAGFSLVVTLPYLATATIGFAIIGFGISPMCPICTAMAAKSSSLKTSIAITFVSSVGFVGFLIAPPVIGWLSEAIGLHLTVLVGALAGALVIYLTKQLKQK